jgi:hypothetical protein
MLKLRAKRAAGRLLILLSIKSCFFLTARGGRPAIFERVKAWRQRAYANDAGVR